MLDHVDMETYKVDGGWAREPVLPVDPAPIHALIRGLLHRFEVGDSFELREPKIIEGGRWVTAACGKRCQVVMPIEFDDDQGDTDLCKDCSREVADWVIAPLTYAARQQERRARRAARDVDGVS